MSTGKPIKVGIAGLGRSGWHIHANAIDLVGRSLFEVVAVTDPDPDRCQDAIEKFGATVHDSFESLVADENVELVVVATPNHLHAEHAEIALKAGKNVVVEKPLGCNAQEVEPVIQLAEEAGLILAPFQNRRYDAHFQKMQEIVDSGQIGRIVEVRVEVRGFTRRWDWQTLKEFGGGILNNTGAHFLDQALLYIDGDDLDVFSHMDRVIAAGDAEDHATVLVRGKQGPLVLVELTSACARPTDMFMIVGSKGTLWGSMQELHWKTTSFDDLPDYEAMREPTQNRGYQFEAVEWEEHSWKISEKEADVSWTHQQFYLGLAKAIRGEESLYITPRSVMRLLSVMDAAKDSAEASFVDCAK